MTENTPSDALVEAMKIAEQIGPFDLKVRHTENYSGEHREWCESMRVPQGNPDVAQAAATVIAEAMAAKDAELAEALARVRVLEGELTFYADTYCEGIGECVGDFCGKLSAEDCGGCRAHAALGSAKA